MNNFIKGLIIIVILVIVVGLFSVFNRVETVAETIKIGVIAPLSGVRADGGEFTKNALALAEEDINKDFKNKVEFIFEDTKYEPQTAVSAFKKVVELDGVGYVIGPHGSSEVMAVGPLAEKDRVILIATAAQSDEISDLGDYVFRLIHNSAQEAPWFAKFVSKKMSGGTLHFIAINTAITDPYLKNFTPSFEAEGKKIGLVERFESSVADYRTQLLKIKSQNPTDMLIIAAPKQTGLILKQANELGIRAKFYSIGVEGPELIAQAGELANGLIYPYSYDNKSSDTRIKSFFERYLERFGKEPDTVAANSYDAAYLLGECFDKYGNNRDKIKSCLYDVKNYMGASGTFSIDSKGDAIKNLLIKTVKDGKFVLYE